MTVIAEGCEVCNPMMWAHDHDPDTIAVDRVYLDADDNLVPAVTCEVFLHGQKLTTVCSVMRGEGDDLLALQCDNPPFLCPCGSGKVHWFLDSGPYVVEPSGLRPIPEYVP